MPNPAIPGTPADRTGSGAILRRALREIDARFKGLQAEILAIFDAIPTYAINADALPQVGYGLTPQEMAATSQALREALDRWIADRRIPSESFWWSPYVDDAAQAGSAQSAANLAALAPAYAAARSLEQIVYSAPYRTRVNFAQVKSYEHWVGLSDAMRSELSQIIGRAVVDGKNPKAVRTEIMERLDVSRSKAAQYAQTDITDTLRQARWAESDHARDTIGIKTGMLWTSALLSTTRRTHGAKNGKVLSTKEVREFYARDGNRYNCHCGQTEALLDADGNAILTDRLKASMLAERQAWQQTHDPGE